MQVAREQLRSLISDVVRVMAEEKGISVSDLPDTVMERPRHEGQGDLSTTVAMQLAGIFRDNPRKIAAAIIDRLGENENVDRIEIAGPGFINFFLNNLWMKGTVCRILKEGASYGSQDLGKGRKVQVEFVSANPTGPLHIGHGRGAAVGDIVSSILDFTGWNVSKEYYVNDAGLQMEMLGRSTQSRYFEINGKADALPFPADGYNGHYIYDIAEEIRKKEGDRFLSVDPDETLEFFTSYASDCILEGIKEDLSTFGVTFDKWFSEKTLYERSLVPSAVELLVENGYAYTAEDAVWFKTTLFDDEKDRVLIRANGVPTYFASDIAYHKDKFDRGFDRVIDVWGADHHGYVPRMKAAVSALGKDKEAFDVLLIQFVNLLRQGVQVPMSTRSGEFVTLKDVLEEVGTDATRYFFVMRRSDSHLDFDLDLAKKASTDNPVYYVQYAHARICSVISEAEERSVTIPSYDQVDPGCFDSPEGKKLATTLAIFPDEIKKASEELAPHMLVNYVHELAGDFHSFYNAHRILGEDSVTEGTRLLLVSAVRNVIAKSLELLGMNAPERM
jgi:arginyl-tRNA synthetase